MEITCKIGNESLNRWEKYIDPGSVTSAAASKDSEQSIFTSRCPSRVAPLIVTLRTGDMYRVIDTSFWDKKCLGL